MRWPALEFESTLSGYRIEIETREGLVTLTGSVATRAQKAEAMARAGACRGVSAVVDMIQVVVTDGVRPAHRATDPDPAGDGPSGVRRGGRPGPRR